MTSGAPITGGCQCGAVRYRATGLGRASVCHCRMCQRATGNVMAPLVVAEGIEWEGTPGTWASSNISERGFCRDCGTPVGFRPIRGGEIHVYAARLDDPEAREPAEYVDALPLRVEAGENSDGPASAAAATAAATMADARTIEAETPTEPDPNRLLFRVQILSNTKANTTP